MFKTLKSTSHALVHRIELNRPDKRNAMNLAMCGELIEAISMAHADPQTRVVVITGNGPSFCSGVDIAELQGQSADWVMERRSLGLDAFLAVERCPIPVIAVVHGATYGAGAELASACDFIIASHDAVFQWPEALRGSVGATQRLPRAVGLQMAKELLFTARKLDASEARTLGLVNRVVPAESLAAETQDAADAISRCGPMAVRWIKQAMNEGESMTRSAAIELERSLIHESLQHPEWREAIDGFSKNRRS